RRKPQAEGRANRTRRAQIGPWPPGRTRADPTRVGSAKKDAVTRRAAQSRPTRERPSRGARAVLIAPRALTFDPQPPKS
ncbi:MAG: hypothetical protein CVT86_04445, partial [Alphaproteobacteria bacterium HGW-Alphaproteobacteria-8]